MSTPLLSLFILYFGKCDGQIKHAECLYLICGTSLDSISKQYPDCILWDKSAILYQNNILVVFVGQVYNSISTKYPDYILVDISHDIHFMIISLYIYISYNNHLI